MTPTLASQLLASAHRGDPLADAVIAEFDGDPALERSLINRGLQQGRASLTTCPPALDALLRQSECLPAVLDAARLQRGAEAWLSIPAFWLTMALGPGSLTHTYSAPLIAKVLMKTQNLQARTARRLAETSLWSHQVVRPQALVPGAPGYVHTVQVRLLHARVRAATLRGGWQAERGSPVSQRDLLRTWFDFTFVPFGALEKLGLGFAPEDITDLYAMWHGVAHLLGIDAALYQDVWSQAQAAEMLAEIDAQGGPPNADSSALTLSMLQALGQLAAPMLHMPVEVASGLMQSMCRHIHGDELADALGVERSWTASLLPALVDANRYRRARDMATPALRQARIAQTLREFDAVDSQLSGDTTYQAHARQPAAGLPVTPTVSPQAATAT